MSWNLTCHSIPCRATALLHSLFNLIPPPHAVTLPPLSHDHTHTYTRVHANTHTHTLQAILPLRGKILNIEKASTDKIYQNTELQSLIAAIGLGVRGTISPTSRSFPDHHDVLSDVTCFYRLLFFRTILLPPFVLCRWLKPP